MNNKIKYTIEIDNSSENRELIDWLNKQENLNEFIVIMLEKAMIEQRNKEATMTNDELNKIINSLDDSFWDD